MNKIKFNFEEQVFYYQKEKKLFVLINHMNPSCKSIKVNNIKSKFVNRSIYSLIFRLFFDKLKLFCL